MAITDRRGTQRRILLCMDACEQAMDAVLYVGAALSSEETTVVLFHVTSKIPETFYDTAGPFPQRRSSIRSWELEHNKIIQVFMDQALVFLMDLGFPQEAVKIDIRQGKTGIARDIAVEAQRGYSAIVVGRVGASKLKDLVLGSTGNKLIEKLTHLPVWVVGGKPRAGKVLLALDSSEGAMRAVDYVGTMLGGSACEVTLFHVIRGLGAYTRRLMGVSPGDEEKWMEKSKTIVIQVFDEAKSRLVEAGVDANRITTKFTTQVRSRARAIVKEAEEEGYETIVVGRRGLSKIQEFYMGRVSNKVLQIAKEMAVWVVS